MIDQLIYMIDKTERLISNKVQTKYSEEYQTKCLSFNAYSF